MKKKIFVIASWRKLKQADVDGFAFNTVTMMTDNTYFTDPEVPLTDMSKAATRYAVAYGNRKNGGSAKAEFKNAKTALFKLLAEQGGYVTEQAKTTTDENVIESAGFVSSKTSNSKAVTPAQPKTPGALYKNGELVLTVDTVPGAANYCWVIFFGAAFPITVAGNVLDIDQKARYMIIPAGTTREVVRNIGVGQDLYVQVLAQNAAGKSPFSAAVFVHTGTN